MISFEQQMHMENLYDNVIILHGLGINFAQTAG